MKAFRLLPLIIGTSFAIDNSLLMDIETAISHNELMSAAYARYTLERNKILVESGYKFRRK
jgi:hypothetical protein